MKQVKLLALVSALTIALSGIALADELNPNESSIVDDVASLLRIATPVGQGSVALNPNESSLYDEVAELSDNEHIFDIAVMEYIPGSRTAPAVDEAFLHDITNVNF